MIDDNGANEVSQHAPPREVALVEIFEVNGKVGARVHANLSRALEVLNAVTENVRYEFGKARMAEEAESRRVEVSRAELTRALRTNGGKLQ
jgi:hypothetical protein